MVIELVSDAVESVRGKLDQCRSLLFDDKAEMRPAREIGVS